LKYFNSADVSVTAAGDQYNAGAIAGLDAAHKTEANNRGYDLLNLMMANDSPAKNMITTGSQNNSIPIGEGHLLYRKICSEWSLLEADTTNTNMLALQLNSKKMRPDEGAYSFTSDFNTTVDKLKNKGPLRISVNLLDTAHGLGPRCPLRQGHRKGH
jgi:hypothetical protein